MKKRLPDLVELVYPAPQALHLDVLLVVLELQLRDGLFLLAAVQLQLLQRRAQRVVLVLQRRHVLLLLREGKGGSKGWLPIYNIKYWVCTLHTMRRWRWTCAGRTLIKNNSERSLSVNTPPPAVFEFSLSAVLALPWLARSHTTL